jgi:hypothetical protein
MSRIVFLLSLMATSFGLTSASHARETYCSGSYVRVYDGGTFASEHTAVIGSARKTQLPGQRNPTTGCSYNWNSLGGFYRPIEILKQPRLGSVSVPQKYRIFYKPTKVGNDEFVVRIHWIGPVGKLQSAVVTYRIRNIDRPI